MLSLLTAGLLAVAPLTSTPDLKVGDPAPPLSIAEWVKGEPVSSFEPGKVYLVEFWATWCGPCIAGMPHLSELEAKYADKGFAVIGVTSVDGSNTLERVKKMAADKGDVMGYRVAWDVERTTNEAYMVAAGQNGIPCCFLVDKKGKIAYIGHPAFVDPAVEGVLDGSWDPDKGMKQIEEAKKDLQKLYRIGDPKDAIKAIDKFVKDNPALAGMVADLRYEMHLRAGSKDAQKYGEELYEKAVAQKDAVKLNELAWRLVDPESEIKKPDLDFALRAAQKADELTGGEDASILDTLARVHFVRGDVAKAIELQKRAVEHADGEMKDQLEKTLADYEKKAG